MTSYQLYVFLMCLIVFVLLASLSIFCIYTIMRLTIRLIRHGAEDERILDEHKKSSAKKRKGKLSKLLGYAFSGIVCFVLLAVLVCSLIIKGTNGSVVGDIPVYRVVNTGSMAKKNERNQYLYENKLDNQIQTFDLIRTEKLPDEMELKLYDIVVYETDGMLIVHRIVEIEEPNQYHPNCRHFRLQGDSVESPDRFPVLYSQMRAIYNGERIPFIGSFIMFMQSPAGWLCSIFVLLSVCAIPFLESKLEKEKEKRLLLYMGSNSETVVKKRIPEAPSVTITKFSPITLHTMKGGISAVTLDQLNSSYNAGETVDIGSLKSKELVHPACRLIKIIAYGKLEKALTVKADFFSPKAREAIILAGGIAITLPEACKSSSATPNSKEYGGGDTNV